MNLKKRYCLLLLSTVIIGCRPNEKSVQDRKTIKDTIQTNVVIKDVKKPVADTATVRIDTAAVLNAFKKTIKTAPFMKELDFNSQDGLSGSVFDSERPILIGDLNGDHLDDAIMPFSIEGRQGGNNWDAHYAIFINSGGRLTYRYSFSRGGDLAETQIDFKSIQDGVIKGMEVPGFHSEGGENIPVNYIYKNTGLSELVAASETK